MFGEFVLVGFVNVDSYVGLCVLLKLVVKCSVIYVFCM